MQTGYVDLRNHRAQEFFFGVGTVYLENAADQPHERSHILADETRERGVPERPIEHLMKNSSPARVRLKQDWSVLGQSNIPSQEREA